MSHDLGRYHDEESLSFLSQRSPRMSIRNDAQNPIAPVTTPASNSSSQADVAGPRSSLGFRSPCALQYVVLYIWGGGHDHFGNGHGHCRLPAPSLIPVRISRPHGVLKVPSPEFGRRPCLVLTIHPFLRLGPSRSP